MAAYRLFGDLWLSDPSEYLTNSEKSRLRSLEPHFSALDKRLNSTDPLKVLNLQQEFAHFQLTESALWNPPRPKDELVPPSGSLHWPLAHHLHNPSFTTLNALGGGTEDETNPCVWLIMANSFMSGETMIFDHLARREVVDGFKMYPKHILACHEQWLSRVRSIITAKVEIVYGRAVQDRMLRTKYFEQFTLWGGYADVNLHLEWTNGTMQQRTLHRIIVFVHHPQLFLQPWGKRWAATQDLHVYAAHKLAGLTCQNHFYRNLHWSVVNRFPKLQNYPHLKESAQAAIRAITTSLEKESDLRLKSILPTSQTAKPGVWSAGNAVHRLLADADQNAFLLNEERSDFEEVVDAISNKKRHNGVQNSIHQSRRTPTDVSVLKVQTKVTKISDLITSDNRKPAFLRVKCKTCGCLSIDRDPKWHRKTGSYVAKKKKCFSRDCLKMQTAVPEHASIKFVT
ncbi:MAG: hypothetical protein M1821_007023 [Bathelium mastoideum]|nr:MAG: hypothetical protein M1821_007023 [Bathelium mastoideum]